MHHKLTKVVMMSIFISTGCSMSSHLFSGYIEGEYTYISSGMTGTLLQLYVQQGQNIKKGDLLFQLDPEPELSTVTSEQANVKDYESQVIFAKNQLIRQQKLFSTKNTTRVDLDQAETSLNSKLQQAAAENSRLIQAKWMLSQKKIFAPVSGVVFDVFYRVGEKVEAAHPVLAILAPENIKVQFYVPENILSLIHLGQKISFTCDSCYTRKIATISYISPEAEYTPPIIYNKDTRYKLVYLIRAIIPENEAIMFHPGQPVDVDLSL